MHPRLSICTLAHTEALSEAIFQALRDHDYRIHSFKQAAEFLNFVVQERQQVDCLVLEESPQNVEIFEVLRQASILLPIVLLEIGTTRNTADALSIASDLSGANFDSDPYDGATSRSSITQIGQLNQTIDQAINQFLNLSPKGTSNTVHTSTTTTDSDRATHSMLATQQRRLADKLRERLGYLGVYYKRNPQNFLRYMSRDEKDAIIQTLRDEYREIVLSYFTEDEAVLNEKIDSFVNTAFFIDVSVAQVVEIHMELMDEFSKQLKLEGRSEEILLDYRLTLIDMLAHLCEMYRRSIPREA